MLCKLMIALSAALLASLVAEPLAAQKICPDGKLAGANQPCGPQTATAKKEGKATRSGGGLKMEQDVIEEPRKKPGKAAPRI